MMLHPLQLAVTFTLGFGVMVQPGYNVQSAMTVTGDDAVYRPELYKWMFLLPE